eukprot:10058611-Heterocapsa_arctica.AAC.1
MAAVPHIKELAWVMIKPMNLTPFRFWQYNTNYPYLGAPSRWVRNFRRWLRGSFGFPLGCFTFNPIGLRDPDRKLLGTDTSSNS